MALHLFLISQVHLIASFVHVKERFHYLVFIIGFWLPWKRACGSCFIGHNETKPPNPQVNLFLWKPTSFATTLQVYNSLLSQNYWNEVGHSLICQCCEINQCYSLTVGPWLYKYDPLCSFWFKDNYIGIRQSLLHFSGGKQSGVPIMECISNNEFNHADSNRRKVLIGCYTSGPRVIIIRYSSVHHWLSLLFYYQMYSTYRYVAYILCNCWCCTAM